MNLIFDVGAHRGEDTAFYLQKGFRVVTIEADPGLAQGLRETFSAQIEQGKLTVVEAAIAEKSGTVEFFQNEQSSVWGTIHQDWAERNAELGAPSSRIKVRAVRFEDLLEEYGIPYYLKIDIEGADMLCVVALGSFNDRPRYVSVESNKTSWDALKSEFDSLEALGYHRFKIVNQATIEQQVEPVDTQEGTYSGHAIKFGSSGLFGSDLPGRWLTRSQAVRRYGPIFAHYRMFGDNTIGQRLSWRLPKGVQGRLAPGWYDTHAAR